MTLTQDAENELSAKDGNNSWNAMSRYWGDDFVVTVETEGNEGEGEIPHTNATMLTLPDYLGEQDGFTANSRPASPDEVSPEDERVRHWEADGDHELSHGVDLTLTLEGPTDLLDAEFDGLANEVAEALPDDWEVKA